MVNHSVPKLVGNYIFLAEIPSNPLQSTPTRDECFGYEFMMMVQLCNIAEKYNISRFKACKSFGGDKGKYQVITDRMARVVGIRKYVLIRAADQYFKEMGISW
jgi:hypothetical protein